MPKCTYCSAPLPKSGIICEYCGSRNDIDLREVKKKVSLRPHENRECPVCNVPLYTMDVGVKVPLFIEHCDSCYGLFFDSHELEELIHSKVKSSHNVDYKKLLHLNNNPRYIDVITYRRCPVCSSLMNRVNYAKRSGVIMDVCSDHGIWLDPGELTHILEWSHTAGVQVSEKRAETPAQQDMRRTWEPEPIKPKNPLELFWELFDWS